MGHYTTTGRVRVRWRRYPIPGRPSDYIQHARDEIKAGDLVVLWLRVSGWVQNKNDNLWDQEANLRRVAEELGAIVVGVVEHVGPGWDPVWISRAVGMAERCGARCILAESTCRFVRSHVYDQHNQGAKPTDADLWCLKQFVGDVVLVTVEDPDELPGVVRGYQTIRGQRMKGRRGGRPPKNAPGYKKQRRIRHIETVHRLRASGHSVRAIAGEIRVPHTTVQDWLKR